MCAQAGNDVACTQSRLANRPHWGQADRAELIRIGMGAALRCQARLAATPRSPPFGRGLDAEASYTLLGELAMGHTRWC